MVSDKHIEALLEKYDNGETSLKEEQQLRDYFSQNKVASHLEPYRAMFQYFAKTKKETFTKDVPVKTRKRSYVYQWISVAAVVAIMFGVFTQFSDSGSDKQTYASLTDEEKMVYDQTKEALNLLSSKFSQGTSNVSVLGVVGTQFDKGAEKVEYVKEFSNTTDKILKKPTKNK